MAEDERSLVELPLKRAKALFLDSLVLDQINTLLSAQEWPGASGMEDIHALVRTVREEVPGVSEWRAH